MTVGGGRTVLVVDDDPALRMLCRVNLELDGYGVLEADTVDDAAAHVAGGGVDVILLDIHMGGRPREGLDLLDRLPQDRPAVALLTGSVDISSIKGSSDVDAIISKPFALDELATVVGDLARR